MEYVIPDCRFIHRARHLDWEKSMRTVEDIYQERRDLMDAELIRWRPGQVIHIMLFPDNIYRSNGIDCWHEWPWGGILDTINMKGQT